MALDTQRSITDFLDHVLPGVTSYASEYGEPGYSLDGGMPLIVMSDYWCRCEKFADTDADGTVSLHGIERHYPYAFARMEDIGVQFEWHDEWIVDHETDKAYRQTGDSYHWPPSYVVTDGGDMLTPDDDIDTWIEWALNNAHHCLLSNIHTSTDLEFAGFEQYNGQYENGWHPGQNDDPETILARIQEMRPSYDVVFWLGETGQFDIRFNAFIRLNRESIVAKIGREHGINAAQWWEQDTIGGRVARHDHAISTARLTLDGIESGDPEIIDTLPSPDLSGQWADGYSSHDLEAELAIPHVWQTGYLTGTRTCEVCGLLPLGDGDESTPCVDANGSLADVYVAAFTEAVESEISRACRFILA